MSLQLLQEREHISMDYSTLTDFFLYARTGLIATYRAEPLTPHTHTLQHYSTLRTVGTVDRSKFTLLLVDSENNSYCTGAV